MIRLMTYNIHGAIGMDNEISAERIADVIRQSRAQIVCLQEVHTFRKVSDNVDQPAVLGALLGMQVAFQRNYRSGAGGLGNAILTSFDLRQARSHILTSQGEQRGIIEANINTPAGPLTVFCTHFGLDRKERLTQAHELAELLNAATGPRLACGDFNAEPSEESIKDLIRLGRLVDSSAGGPPTFDAAKPSKRIDLILCGASIQVLSNSLIDTRASDHLPLVADLELAG